MKTTISITVDYDALLAAKRKVENISSYINDCLKSLADSSISDDPIEEQLKALNNTLQDAKIKKDILTMELKRRQELAAEHDLESESKKRWICPIDSQRNLMDNKRCSCCNLPIRDDPKTSFIYIDDEVKL